MKSLSALTLPKRALAGPTIIHKCEPDELGPHNPTDWAIMSRGLDGLENGAKAAFFSLVPENEGDRSFERDRARLRSIGQPLRMRVAKRVQVAA